VKRGDAKIEEHAAKEPGGGVSQSLRSWRPEK
jgi:hypothetical protein